MTAESGYRNPVTATLKGLREMVRSTGRIGQLSPLDRLDGQSCLVTGASSGLGAACAIELARRGADLIIAGRGDLEPAAARIRVASGCNRIRSVALDLTDIESIHNCGRQLAGQRIDRLILNAGLMPRKSRLTAQGFEVMFGVHFLGNLTLVHRLLKDGTLPNRTFANQLPQARSIPRIVVVSSESHRSAPTVDFESFSDPVDYGAMGGMAQYGRSKLLLTILAKHLSRTLQDHRGLDVAVHCLCPGPVNSGIAREAPRWVKPLLGLLMAKLFASPEQACEPLSYLSCSRAIEGRTGLYLHRMTPRLPADQCLDPVLGRRLWARGLELSGGA